MQQQYLPVNWIDGMKINKSHFEKQNHAVTCQSAQAIGSMLNEYNYGLLHGTHNRGNDLKLSVSANNQQQVQIRLQKCLAISYGGFSIQFDEDTSLNSNHFYASIPDLSISFSELKGRSTAYYIVLVVNPYERVPCGHADPAETPLRLPFTMPSYQLQLVPVGQAGKNVLGAFHIPVGKLLVRDQNVLQDEAYTPPCCSVSSHSNLMDLHAGLEQFFGTMELNALQIIQKILQKQQKNEMACIVQKMCEYIIQFTASSLGLFTMINLYQPPVFLVNTVSSFARLLKNVLDIYTGCGKEELVNYFMGWCEVSQGVLESVITSLANHQYNHLEVNDSLQQISRFTSLITRLFSGLARLDYIGQKEMPGIFVKEQVVSSYGYGETAAVTEPINITKRRPNVLSD